MHQPTSVNDCKVSDQRFYLLDMIDLILKKWSNLDRIYRLKRVSILLLND